MRIPSRLSAVGALLAATAACDPRLFDYEPPERYCGPRWSAPVLTFDGARVLAGDASLSPDLARLEPLSGTMGGLAVPSTGGRGFLLIVHQRDAVLAAPLAPGESRLGPAQVILRRPRFHATEFGDRPATDLGGAGFDGQNYVFTWAETDEPVFGAGDYDRTVKVARVTPAGLLLDPEGLTLHAGLGRRPLNDVETELPVVGSNGRGSLIVWAHRDSRWPRVRHHHSLYAARLTADGQLLDPEGFVIVEEAGDFTRPSLLWDGDAYVLVYQSAYPGRVLHGLRLSAEGEVLGELFSVPLSDRDEHPHAATNGRAVLVAWHSCRSIRAVLVDSRTGPSLPPAFTVGESTAPTGGLCFWELGLSAAPGGFAVAWTEDHRPQTGCSPVTLGVFLRRIGADGSQSPIARLRP